MKKITKLGGILLSIFMTLSLFSCSALGDVKDTIDAIDEGQEIVDEYDNLGTAPDWSDKTVVKKFGDSTDLEGLKSSTVYTFFDDNTFEYEYIINDALAIGFRGTYEGDIKETPEDNNKIDINLTFNGVITSDEKYISSDKEKLWKLNTNNKDLTAEGYIERNDKGIYFNDGSLSYSPMN